MPVVILWTKSYRLRSWTLGVFSLDYAVLERTVSGAQESGLRLFHLVWHDGRNLLIGDAGQVYGPIDHPARGAGCRPRDFRRAQQCRTHRFTHIIDRRSSVRQGKRVMDAVFDIASDPPRAVDLASAPACREIAADSSGCRTGTIHAAWNLLGSRATEARAAPLSGSQVAAKRDKSGVVRR